MKRSKRKFCSRFCYCKWQKGKCFISKQGREMIRRQKTGKNNPSWKEKGVGYAALHKWVRTHAKIPDQCEKCGKIKLLDAANKSGEYKRDLEDWEFLCRRCHMESDGRLNIKTTYIEYNGVRDPIGVWAKRLKIKSSTIQKRKLGGWNDKEIVIIPLRKRRKVAPKEKSDE